MNEQKDSNSKYFDNEPTDDCFIWASRRVSTTAIHECIRVLPCGGRRQKTLLGLPDQKIQRIGRRSGHPAWHPSFSGDR
jgi:hypothetical protein